MARLKIKPTWEVFGEFAKYGFITIFQIAYSKDYKQLYAYISLVVRYRVLLFLGVQYQTGELLIGLGPITIVIEDD